MPQISVLAALAVRDLPEEARGRPETSAPLAIAVCGGRKTRKAGPSQYNARMSS